VDNMRCDLRMNKDTILHTVFGWASSVTELRPQHHMHLTLAMLKPVRSASDEPGLVHSVVTLRNLLPCSVRIRSKS
jgi:hypothetical protein